VFNVRLSTSARRSHCQTAVRFSRLRGDRRDYQQDAHIGFRSSAEAPIIPIWSRGTAGGAGLPPSTIICYITCRVPAAVFRSCQPHRLVEDRTVNDRSQIDIQPSARPSSFLISTQASNFQHCGDLPARPGWLEFPPSRSAYYTRSTTLREQEVSKSDLARQRSTSNKIPGRERGVKTDPDRLSAGSTGSKSCRMARSRCDRLELSDESCGN